MFVSSRKVSPEGNVLATVITISFQFICWKGLTKIYNPALSPLYFRYLSYLFPISISDLWVWLVFGDNVKSLRVFSCKNVWRCHAELDRMLYYNLLSINPYLAPYIGISQIRNSEHFEIWIEFCLNSILAFRILHNVHVRVLLALFLIRVLVQYCEHCLTVPFLGTVTRVDISQSFAIISY